MPENEQVAAWLFMERQFTTFSDGDWENYFTSDCIIWHEILLNTSSSLPNQPIPPHPWQLQRLPHIASLAPLRFHLAQLPVRLGILFLLLDPSHQVRPIIENLFANPCIAWPTAPDRCPPIIERPRLDVQIGSCLLDGQKITQLNPPWHSACLRSIPNHQCTSD